MNLILLQTRHFSASVLDQRSYEQKWLLTGVGGVNGLSFYCYTNANGYKHDVLRGAYQSSAIIAYLLYHVQLAYIVLSSHVTVRHESEHISVFLRQPKVETFTFQHCFRIKPNTDGLIIASKHGLFQLFVYPSVLASTHQADVQPGLMLFAVPHYVL